MTVHEDGIPGWEGAELMRAIHAGESHALAAFYSYFRPLLVERAHLFGIARPDCGDAVETFLGDILLSLARSRNLPLKLHGYVMVSFRRFAARSGKASRVEAGMLTTYGEITDPFTHVEALNQSDTSLTHPALIRFAERLLDGLGSEELLLLGARAEEMPLREIAAMLGMSYNAANTRLCRLRARLRSKAAEVAATTEEADGLVVNRFLRRARGQADSGGDGHRVPGALRVSNG